MGTRLIDVLVPKVGVAAGEKVIWREIRTEEAAIRADPGKTGDVAILAPSPECSRRPKKDQIVGWVDLSPESVPNWDNER